MTALSKPETRADAGDQAADSRLRLLRELGSQTVPAWAALESVPGEKPRLVVVERADRNAVEDGEIADWIRDARRLSTLDHPNLARVRSVVIRSGEVLVVSDFVDGVRWKEFAERANLETALRVLVDALTGLSALHNMRDTSDPKRALFKLVHGGLTPDGIIVGLDGVGRIAGAARLRSANAHLGGTGSAYLAPEVLLEDDSADARADVYSIGVMLWEALGKRRFLPDLQPSAIVTQLLSGRVPPVTLPEGVPWAAPLADVVMRALSADPEKRFPTAAAMAAEVRRIGALKMPLATRVAASVRESFGDAAKTRREILERGEIRPSEVSVRGRKASVDEIAVDVSDEIQAVSTVPPAVLAAVTVPAFEPLRAVSVVTDAPQDAPPPRPPAPAPVAAPPPAPLLHPLAESTLTEITTAAPFAVVTQATPPSPEGRRRQGPIALAAAGAAVLIIGLAAWWMAARGSDAPPAVVHAAYTATAQVAAPPTPKEPVPPSSAASGIDPAPSPASDVAPANAPPNNAPAFAPGASARTFVPAPPNAQTPRPKRRNYDPQGI